MEILNEEALIKQYLDKVEYFASLYSNNYEDRKDLIQEGQIGLLSAIRNFDSKRNVSFSTYAGHCIKNRILDYLRKVEDMPIEPEIEIEDSSLGPEELLLFKDYLNSFKSQLSDFEYNVMTYMLDGYTNAKIAENLETSVSSIYNANQRIRQKLSAILNPATSAYAERK